MTRIFTEIPVTPEMLRVIDNLAEQFDCSRAEVMAHVAPYGLHHYTNRHLAYGEGDT